MIRCEDCIEEDAQCTECAAEDDREAWYTAMEVIEYGERMV